MRPASEIATELRVAMNEQIGDHTHIANRVSLLREAADVLEQTTIDRDGLSGMVGSLRERLAVAEKKIERVTALADKWEAWNYKQFRDEHRAGTRDMMIDQGIEEGLESAAIQVRAALSDSEAQA